MTDTGTVGALDQPPLVERCKLRCECIKRDADADRYMSSRPVDRHIGVGLLLNLDQRVRVSFNAAVTQAVRNSNAFNRGVVLAVERSMKGGLCVFYKSVGPDANGDTVYKVVRAKYQAEAATAAAVQRLVRARWGSEATRHFARFDDPIPFTHNGEAYVVMAAPRLHGGDVWQALTKDRVLDPVALLGQIIMVVNMLHSCGWVHRDLKFENLMFATAAQDVVVLVDFGFSAKVGAKVQLCVGTKEYWTRRQKTQCDGVSRPVVDADPYEDWVAFAKMVFAFRREIGTGGLPPRFCEAATSLFHESNALMTRVEAIQELLNFAAEQHHRAMKRNMRERGSKLKRSDGIRGTRYKHSLVL